MIGSGFGEELLKYKRENPNTKFFCVDLSERALSKSAKVLDAKTFKADACKLPFKNNFFDGISILEVLEHIEADHLAVKELFRVLKSSGYIVASTPSGRLTPRWKKHGHLRHYTHQKFIHLFTENKFRFVKDINYYERTRLFYRPIKESLRTIAYILNKEYIDLGLYKWVVRPVFLNISKSERNKKPSRISEGKNFALFQKVET